MRFLTENDKILCGDQNNTWALITWQINVLLQFKPLLGDYGDDDGPNQWKWRTGSNRSVDPGCVLTSDGDNWESGWYFR